MISDQEALGLSLAGEDNLNTIKMAESEDGIDKDLRRDLFKIVFANVQTIPCKCVKGLREKDNC